ncbi:MAG: hypothetical protein ABIW32_01955 [Terrimesophilobacter sp.]
MTDSHIISTTLRVSGVRTDHEVIRALQALYNVFADLSLGQATFEVTHAGPAELYIKHKDTVTVDVAAINAALAQAGDFHVVD